MRHNGTPADYCLRHFDGEGLKDTEPDTDRHDSQLLWALPALAVFTVAALIWMAVK